MQTIASPARRPPARIACYGETPDLRTRIGLLLADADLGTTGSRADFESRLEDAIVGIVALKRCEPADLAWLRAAFDYGHCAPSCVLVTPHSLARSRWLRRVQSSRLHVVWAEEAGARLLQLLNRVEPWHQDPLRLLGHRLLSDFPLRRTLVEVIDHVCRVFADPPPGPPPATVTALARGVALLPTPCAATGGKRCRFVAVPSSCSTGRFSSGRSAGAPTPGGTRLPNRPECGDARWSGPPCA